jgi:hypothetical protein
MNAERPFSILARRCSPSSSGVALVLDAHERDWRKPPAVKRLVWSEIAVVRPPRAAGRGPRLRQERHQSGGPRCGSSRS